MLNRIRRLFPPGGKRRTVELQPVDQRILQALLHFERMPFDRLQAEISAEHETLPGETLLALLKLEHEGLVVRDEAAGESRQTASYSLSIRGTRLTRAVPMQGTNNIDVQL